MPRRIFCIEPLTYQLSNSRQQILFCYLLRFLLLRPNTESIFFWPTNRVSSKSYDDCFLKSSLDGAALAPLDHTPQASSNLVAKDRFKIYDGNCYCDAVTYSVLSELSAEIGPPLCG